MTPDFLSAWHELCVKLYLAQDDAETQLFEAFIALTPQSEHVAIDMGGTNTKQRFLEQLSRHNLHL